MLFNFKLVNIERNLNKLISNILVDVKEMVVC